MQRAALAVLPFLLAGCPKGGPTSSEGPLNAELRAWHPPPKVVTYTRMNRAGPLPLPDVASRDEWVGPELEDGRLVYVITTYDVREVQAEPLYKVKAFYGTEGFGYLGSWEGDTYVAWEPPQVVLPSKPAVGQVWRAVHTKGAVQSERTCEILAGDVCEDGMVVVCDSKRDGGRIIMRDHFCPGIGWASFEAMALVGDNPPVRMWSEHFERDGVSVPMFDTEGELDEGAE